jgi:hypothetical protein
VSSAPWTFAVIVAAAFWLLLLLSSPFFSFFVFGRDENMARMLIFAGGATVGLFMLAAADASDRSLSELVRLPVTWLSLGVVVVIFAWPIIGIDSLRPLRALPEAAITFPGSTLVRAGGDEGLGVGDGDDQATLTWIYHTAASYDDVLTFYDRDLTSRGWTSTGPGLYMLSSGASCIYGWRRDDGYGLTVWIPVAEVAHEDIATPADLSGGGDYRVILGDKPKRPSEAGPVVRAHGRPNPCWR